MKPEEVVTLSVDGEELLPCPFCGGTAVIFMSGNGESGSLYSVECILCGMGNSGVIYRNPQEALKAWNNRGRNSSRFCYEEEETENEQLSILWE